MNRGKAPRGVQNTDRRWSAEARNPCKYNKTTNSNPKGVADYNVNILSPLWGLNSLCGN